MMRRPSARPRLRRKHRRRRGKRGGRRVRLRAGLPGSLKGRLVQSGVACDLVVPGRLWDYPVPFLVRLTGFDGESDQRHVQWARRPRSRGVCWENLLPVCLTGSARKTVSTRDPGAVALPPTRFGLVNARMFLQAGKHVCVEYPMTLSYDTAKELWELAQKKGVVLHEEHIELLTEDYKQLKKDLDGKVLQGGSLHFTGEPLKPGSGFPAFSGIARLTWLVSLFGKLSVTAATFEEASAKGYSRMTAQLLTSNNRPLTWIEERQMGLPRAKKVNFVFDSCTVTQIPSAPRGTVGLFMQDLIHFSAKMLGQVSPEELQRAKIQVLHCLELAEKIRQLCTS